MGSVKSVKSGLVQCSGILSRFFIRVARQCSKCDVTSSNDDKVCSILLASIVVFSQIGYYLYTMEVTQPCRKPTKNTQKKYGILSGQRDEKIKKLNAALADLQQNYFEKSAHLNTAQERIIQIKQEVDFLEKEYIKARATILKLEDEQKNSLVKNKLSNEKSIKCKTDTSSRRARSVK